MLIGGMFLSPWSPPVIESLLIISVTAVPKAIVAIAR